jgi:hypothetical protein
MKRSSLRRKTPLTARRPLERRTPLRLMSDRRLIEVSDQPRPELAAVELQEGALARREAGQRVGLAPVSRRRGMRRGRGFAASAAQRRKVDEEGACRILREHEHDLDAGGHLPDDVARALGTWAPAAIDPMHVIDRALGGCDHPDCIIPGDRRLHRPYDEGELDILRYLTLREQAHAVRHVGIVGAIKRITGRDIRPASEPAPGRDRLPHMNKEQQADVVAEFGLIDALHELTGVSWFSAPRETTTEVTW